MSAQPVRLQYRALRFVVVFIVIATDPARYMCRREQNKEDENEHLFLFFFFIFLGGSEVEFVFRGYMYISSFLLERVYY